MTQSIELATPYLVEFKLGATSSYPICFTLYVDDEHPITRKGHILVFTDLKQAKKALVESDDVNKVKAEIPCDVYATFDFPSALETVTNKNKSEDANLVNCINVIFDCVKCIKAKMPNKYRSVLTILADHLTFEMPFADMLANKGIDRKSVLEAMTWSLKEISHSLKKI